MNTHLAFAGGGETLRLSAYRAADPAAGAVYRAQVARLQAAVRTIAQAVAGLRAHAAGPGLDPAVGAQIANTADEFDSALHDIRTEIRNLEDKLGLHPHEAPWDPAIVNPDPRVTMGMIGRWLMVEVEDLEALATRLEEPASGPAGTAPFMGAALGRVQAAAGGVVGALDAIEAALVSEGR